MAAIEEQTRDGQEGREELARVFVDIFISATVHTVWLNGRLMQSTSSCLEIGCDDALTGLTLLHQTHRLLAASLDDGA